MRGRVNIYFSNLRAEMGRHQLSIQDIANKTGMNRDTLSRKLSRKTPIALDEAFMIADIFPENNSLQYLFSEAHKETPIHCGLGEN